MTGRNAAAAVLCAAALALAGGCVSKAGLASQRLQLAAMEQYRDEMDAYHGKVRSHLLSEKRSRLDTALEQSLAQAADESGRVALETALEKARRRRDLEDAFRANLAALDGQFEARQEAFERAVDLAEETLGLMESYDRLRSMTRDLVVREPEIEALLEAYETERSERDAGR
jgi:hypothetical protein